MSEMRDDAPDRYVKRFSHNILSALCRDHAALVLALHRAFEAGKRYESKRIDAVREVAAHD